MDAVDQRIVALLVADARASYAEIGSKVALSAPAVKRRVDRLRSSGIIKGFTDNKEVAVVSGFQGMHQPSGRITTLGIRVRY